MRFQLIDRQRLRVVRVDIGADGRSQLGFFRVEPVAERDVFGADVHNPRAGQHLLRVAQHHIVQRAGERGRVNGVWHGGAAHCFAVPGRAAQRLPHHQVADQLAEAVHRGHDFVQPERAAVAVQPVGRLRGGKRFAVGLEAFGQRRRVALQLRAEGAFFRRPRRHFAERDVVHTQPQPGHLMQLPQDGDEFDMIFQRKSLLSARLQVLSDKFSRFYILLYTFFLQKERG